MSRRLRVHRLHRIERRALMLLPLFPLLLLLLGDIRHGEALGIFSGNAPGPEDVLDAFGYMVAYLGTWLLCPVLALSCAFRRLLLWALRRARRSARIAFARPPGDPGVRASPAPAEPGS